MPTPKQSFYTALDNQQLLEVSGQDSEKFLQGQLTCDLEKVADNQVAFGALCNNKGRVYASFRLLRQPDAFFLVLQPGLLEVTQQNLKKYIPFYKASLADAGERFHRYGLAGPAAHDYLAAALPGLPAGGMAAAAGDDLVLNLGGAMPRFELWAASPDSPLVRGLDRLEQAQLADWMALDMQAGIFLTGPDDVELYTPEEANLDLAGFVSFSKGCYTGQEIVARMHYRGKAGKRLFAVAAEKAATLTETALKDTSGKTLGNISNLLYLNDIPHGMVVLKTTTDLAQPFTLAGARGPVPARVTAFAYG